MRVLTYVPVCGLWMPRNVDVPSEFFPCTISSEVLSSHFERTDFTWPRLVGIKACLDAGQYGMALLGALTVPDICGRVEFPSIAEDMCRYARWFDDNVYRYNIGRTGRNGKQFNCLNGYMCYLLRCRVVHGESLDVEDIPNRPKSEMIRRLGYEKVCFRFTTKPYSEFFDVCGLDGKKRLALFYVSIPQLVMQIISSGEGCFEEHADQYSFDEAYTVE